MKTTDSTASFTLRYILGLLWSSSVLFVSYAPLCLRKEVFVYHPPQFFKVRLWRRETNSLLTVEIYEPLSESEWEMYVGIKFPDWSIVTWLNPVV